MATKPKMAKTQEGAAPRTLGSHLVLLVVFPLVWVRMLREKNGLLSPL